MPVEILPPDVGEGDVFRVESSRREDRSTLLIVTDVDERRRRMERSREQMSRGQASDPPGDIVL